MRLKNRPRIGDIRVVKRFLFVPVELNDIHLWLEFVRIKQRCMLSVYGYVKWVDVSFVDNKNNEISDFNDLHKYF